MKKILSLYLPLLLAFLFISLQLVAAPEDHGRWYSVYDDRGPISPFWLIVGGVVLCFVSYLPLSASDKDTPKGFLTVCLIGGILCIIFGFAQCSG